MTLHYLVSPAGVPNYGDELIILGWLRHLAETAPEVDVVVDCLNPVRARSTLTGAHPRLRLTDTLWQLCLRNWTAGPQATTETVRGMVAAPATAADLAPGIELLRTADVVHLVGGGFINDIWPPFVGLLAGITAAVGHSGGLAAMSGQGLWPPPAGAEDLVRDLARRFDVIDVRDQRSAELIGAPGLTVSGDDAYLRTPPTAGGADVPEVMVSLQSQLAAVDGERLLEFVGRVLRDWGVAGVGLVECAPDQDRDMLAAAQRVLPVTRRYDLPEILRDGLPVRPGQCWLSTRFHPHLVAAAGGASGVALSISPDYYATKHRSLVDAGSRWTILDELRVPERPAAGGYPPERLRDLRAGKLAVARRIHAGAPVGRS
ncbi:polysaccharide pyruvyl transferase family protein [Micromonospora auratinigra]|uniref:Polysaccharide pyruvyl transferase family protein WcaK n=1 Tax=Micromonospora auratinigra TaxID=261654 RepID=A0A1A8ZFW8_9ACTN|nr:polysaccharide pyruvyl transferase family protein [Micromonospora auratinigra]SBT42733.1 Polysaccharide pyruvyl transferase family protein WcaK [Micromonospora auratinigra]